MPESRDLPVQAHCSLKKVPVSTPCCLKGDPSTSPRNARGCGRDDRAHWGVPAGTTSFLRTTTFPPAEQKFYPNAPCTNDENNSSLYKHTAPSGADALSSLLFFDKHIVPDGTRDLACSSGAACLYKTPNLMKPLRRQVQYVRGTNTVIILAILSRTSLRTFSLFSFGSVIILRFCMKCISKIFGSWAQFSKFFIYIKLQKLHNSSSSKKPHLSHFYNTSH